jgi:hypothetical protein
MTTTLERENIRQNVTCVNAGQFCFSLNRQTFLGQVKWVQKKEYRSHCLGNFKTVKVGDNSSAPLNKQSEEVSTTQRSIVIGRWSLFLAITRQEKQGKFPYSIVCNTVTGTSIVTPQVKLLGINSYVQLYRKLRKCL